MTDRDLIGSWRMVAYGDMPATGRQDLHLHADGTAVSEGEIGGEA